MRTAVARLQRHDESLGIDLPGEMCDALGLREGDDVIVMQTSDGIVLRRYDQTFARAMEAADVISRRYDNALRALADA